MFYLSASINFNKDKKTFAFAVIIIKELLTKQFSLNIKSCGTKAPCYVVLDQLGTPGGA